MAYIRTYYIKQWPNANVHDNIIINNRNVFKPGVRPARAWFLEIDPVRIVGMRACVCVCVCPHPRLSITSGVMWHDIRLI